MHPIDVPDTLNELRARIRGFIDEQVIPAETSLLGLESLPRLKSLMSEAKHLGIWGLGHAVEVGGGGVSIVEQVLINEVIGRSEPGATVLGFHTLDDVLRIERFGSREQKDRWVAPLAQGEIFAGLAMTEPDVAGSDHQMMRSPAYRDGDEWVLDGRKWFTTWADRAAFVVVIANTNPTADLDRRFSAFIVPRGTPGLRIERTIPVMGDTESIYGQIALEGVRVPRAALLGARGDGLVVAGFRSETAQLLDATRWIGRAQRAFELMCQRAKVRWTHGAYLRDEGEVHRYVAESAAAIQAARLMALDAAYTIQVGKAPQVRTSLLQVVAAQAFQDVTDRAIQIHGALGVSGDLPLERMYRQARLARLHINPDEIHQMSVAQRILQDPDTVPWHHPTTPVERPALRHTGSAATNTSHLRPLGPRRLSSSRTKESGDGSHRSTTTGSQTSRR
jgi:acyl-CoA dehydrogenase